MPANVVVDAGFLVAVLGRRDEHHDWAVAQGAEFMPPWRTCEAVLTEAFYLLGSEGAASLIALLRRAEVLLSFDLGRDQEPVLALMQKYVDVPMSLADACLVRMTETHADPIVLTTDADFRVYRRHSRQVVPCVMPD
jgi:predicted nucleic acid-binding protein